MVRPLVTLLLSILVLLGTAGMPAHAQAVSPFSTRGGLIFTDADLKLLNQTRDVLLAAKGGDPTRRWTNPKTGASGVTTLMQSFTKQGLPCREIRYDIKAKGQKRRFIIPYCRVKDGSWKIAF